MANAPEVADLLRDHSPGHLANDILEGDLAEPEGIRGKNEGTADARIAVRNWRVGMADQAREPTKHGIAYQAGASLDLHKERSRA
jgi:hypothetical protein